MRSVALVLVVMAAISAMTAYAGEYFDARIEGDALTISSRLWGDISAPRIEKEQVGFTDAAISEDGNTIGWVTLGFGNASYPFPLKLVLFRDGKVIQTFSEFGILTKWMFMGKDAVVVLRQFPHGPELLGFFHYRISDGALLGEYRCGYVYGSNGYELMEQELVPEWAIALAHCPSGDNE